MEVPLATEKETSCGAFAERVGVELSRAERYRVFLSLTVLDLGPARNQAGKEADKVVDDLTQRVQEAVRACDYVELVGDNSLAVLLPETRRQDAETVALRLAGLVTGRLSKGANRNLENAVPVEIASYPDTAGAKTVAEFLEDMAAKSRN
jgi:GGDEF domain-containing protein